MNIIRIYRLVLTPIHPIMDTSDHLSQMSRKNIAQ